MKEKPINFHDGEVLLVDKPLNITSFGAVNRIKRVFVQKTKKKRYKIGHAGTLDPLATGLLILCSGKKTKTISGFQNLKGEVFIINILHKFKSKTNRVCLLLLAPSSPA